MSGILFVLEVVTFILVVHWANRGEQPGAPPSGGGLFAMSGKPDDARAARGGASTAARGAAPRWARKEVAPRWRRRP
ncbi:MAG: hypothetical protein JO111_01100 [Caulobacteraceae bacterium]|nr:hypothetical protein [Caulobacteraceae bacterium]